MLSHTFPPRSLDGFGANPRSEIAAFQVRLVFQAGSAKDSGTQLESVAIDPMCASC